MSWVRGLWLGCAVGGLVSCARQNPAITATPSHDELPTIVEPGRVTPATVMVEGERREAVVRLAPAFEPPALTPDEEQILGEPVPRYRFLRYDPFFAGAQPRVGSWLAGPLTASFGQGLPHTALDQGVSVSGRCGPGGQMVAVDPATRPVGGMHSERTQVFRAGPGWGIRVETDPVAKRVSAPLPNAGP